MCRKVNYLDEVHEDKFAKNGCDTEQGETIANIENSILQGELPGQAFHVYYEL